MDIFTTNSEWITANMPTLLLGGLLFVQWIALQAFFINYLLFRQNLKRPKPDGIRFSILERTVSFQSEQIEGVYAKLAEFNRELTLSGANREKNPRVIKEAQSIETSFVSLGELNLKKRLQEMKTSGSGSSALN